MNSIKYFFIIHKINKLLSKQTNFKIKKIKILSPDSLEQCPQGVYLAKGMWHQEAKINEESFLITAHSSSTQEIITLKYHNAVIVFPTNSKEILEKRKLLKEKFKINISMGNFFYGKYIDKYGNKYNNQSAAIHISEKSFSKLILSVAKIVNYLKQETAIIKDLKRDQFFFMKKNS